MVGLVRIAVASAALAAILVTLTSPPRAVVGIERLIVEFEPILPSATLDRSGAPSAAIVASGPF